mgnify:CR=1 FL=1
MRKGARELGRAPLVHPAMKTLILSLSMLSAALPFATSAHADTHTAALVAPITSSESESIRVVRVTTTSASDMDCETATWPNIPPSCLQREAKPTQSSASLEN